MNTLSNIKKLRSCDNGQPVDQNMFAIALAVKKSKPAGKFDAKIVKKKVET